MIELRDEPADGPPSRALFDEYMALIRVRAGIGPVERIFANTDVFAAAGAAWLVAYADGVPVGCGGLRTLAPGIGEIKRMFVSERARGAGVGRRLLRVLEDRAVAAGHTHVRLLTTPVLHEACALYAAEGYGEIERIENAGGPSEIWLEKRIADRRA